MEHVMFINIIIIIDFREQLVTPVEQLLLLLLLLLWF